MAGTDPQKQLLTLIREFVSEKSQGERRVINLKRRIDDLRQELEAANSALEDAKRFKETTEQELKGLEVELALNEASIQALEARILMVQDEISIVGSEVEAFKEFVQIMGKNKEAAARDDFISQMFDLNAKIRKFQETFAHDFQKENIGGVEEEVDHKFVKTNTDITSGTLENMLAQVVSQIAKEEEEYLAEQNILKQVQLQLIDIERKVSLMEAMVQETEALEDLTRQTSELEKMCTFLSEELEKKCICPSCHLDNVDTLGGILQAS